MIDFMMVIVEPLPGLLTTDITLVRISINEQVIHNPTLIPPVCNKTPE